MDLVERISLVPTLHSVQAWRAHDAGRQVTVLCSRPDIVDRHLRGEMYFSNIPALETDLRAIAAGEPGPGELRLLEVRRIHGEVPVGVFEDVGGWTLRDAAARVRCELPVAAAVALEIFRSYTHDDVATAVTPDGQLVRRVLPELPTVWHREMPSFTGSEPEISVRGRIREGRKILATMSATLTSDADDAETDAAADAFVATLAKVADRASAGRVLAQLLATS